MSKHDDYFRNIGNIKKFYELMTTFHLKNPYLKIEMHQIYYFNARFNNPKYYYILYIIDDKRNIINQWKYFKLERVIYKLTMLLDSVNKGYLKAFYYEPKNIWHIGKTSYNAIFYNI